MEFSEYSINDYDKIEGLVDTKLFTVLNDIEIIDDNHNFISFLNGFTHNLFQINILHGWYYKPLGIAKFLVRNPSSEGNIIYFAWQEYLQNKDGENNDVYIYSTYCGDIYLSNEYDIDKNLFYKNLVSELIMKKLN
jgi:hypothetical protein